MEDCRLKPLIGSRSACRRWLQRTTLVSALALGMGGCVYQPPPAPAYAYAPGYYYYYPGYYYPYPYYYGPPVYGSFSFFFGGHGRWH